MVHTLLNFSKFMKILDHEIWSYMYMYTVIMILIHCVCILLREIRPPITTLYMVE